MLWRKWCNFGRRFLLLWSTNCICLCVFIWQPTFGPGVYQYLVAGTFVDQETSLQDVRRRTYIELVCVCGDYCVYILYSWLQVIMSVIGHNLDNTISVYSAMNHTISLNGGLWASQYDGFTLSSNGNGISCRKIIERKPTCNTFPSCTYEIINCQIYTT